MFDTLVNIGFLQDILIATYFIGVDLNVRINERKIKKNLLQIKNIKKTINNKNPNKIFY